MPEIVNKPGKYDLAYQTATTLESQVTLGGVSPEDLRGYEPQRLYEFLETEWGWVWDEKLNIWVPNGRTLVFK